MEFRHLHAVILIIINSAKTEARPLLLVLVVVQEMVGELFRQITTTLKLPLRSKDHKKGNQR